MVGAAGHEHDHRRSARRSSAALDQGETEMMRNLAGMVAATVIALPTFAHAIPFTGTYEITQLNESAFTPLSLGVTTNPGPNTPTAFSFELQPPTSNIILPDPLFSITTFAEGSINVNDAIIPGAIEVAFSITSPNNDGPVTVTGSTNADLQVLFNPFDNIGRLSWNDPVYFNFGPQLDGIVELDLTDTTFNIGHPGNVGGIARLQQEATIPEPATLAVIGAGLAGIGLAARRRRAA
jgi:hypothetical protein